MMMINNENNNNYNKVANNSIRFGLKSLKCNLDSGKLRCKAARATKNINIGQIDAITQSQCVLVNLNGD